MLLRKYSRDGHHGVEGIPSSNFLQRKRRGLERQKTGKGEGREEERKEEEGENENKMKKQRALGL